MKKLFYFATIILCLCGCNSKNAESKVEDVLENHPDAHSILFFDPSTTKYAEGDESEELRKLDYIAFSSGYIRIKLLGEEEMTLQIDSEPSYSDNGLIYYNPEVPEGSEYSDISFFIRLTRCTMFFDKNGEFLVSNYTQMDEMRMKEYLNILDNQSRKTPRILLRLLEAAEHPDSWHNFEN